MSSFADAFFLVTVGVRVEDIGTRGDWVHLCRISQRSVLYWTPPYSRLPLRAFVPRA